MSKSSSWTTLRLQDDTPRLLVKSRFDEQGYEIQLTDLSRVWGETLSKDAIIQRAEKEGCSIDPSEGDQFEILLEKISSALDGAKGTTLTLTPSDTGSEISLNISADLPGSLPTFYWYPSLQQLPSADLSSNLVIPLVLQAYHLQYNVQQLIDEIAAKDRIIAKVTDRLETAGNDLTTVFPGVSNVKTNRKRSQREQLASHVQGLAEFNEHAWRASHAENHEEEQLSGTILDAVMKSIPASSQHLVQVNEDEWWRSHNTLYALGTATNGSQTGDRVSQRIQKPAGGKPASRHSQKQATPPQSHPRAGTPSTVDDELDTAMDVDKQVSAENQHNGDATTEDEDDLDGPASKTSSQTHGRSQQQEEQPAPQNPSSRKLGMLGGRKERTLSSDSPPQRTAKKGKLGAIGGKSRSKTPQTESEAEQEDEVPSPKPTTKAKLGVLGGMAKATPEPAVSPPEKGRRKLGMLGGKKSNEEPASVEPEIQASPRRRLGVMGGGRARSNTPQPPPSGQGGDAKQLPQQEEEHEPEETEESADKKRERLKRELEEKAPKVPAKKKRKF